MTILATRPIPSDLSVTESTAAAAIGYRPVVEPRASITDLLDDNRVLVALGGLIVDCTETGMTVEHIAARMGIGVERAWRAVAAYSADPQPAAAPATFRLPTCPPWCVGGHMAPQYEGDNIVLHTSRSWTVKAHSHPERHTFTVEAELVETLPDGVDGAPQIHLTGGTASMTTTQALALAGALVDAVALTRAVPR